MNKIVDYIREASALCEDDIIFNYVWVMQEGQLWLEVHYYYSGFDEYMKDLELDQIIECIEKPRIKEMQKKIGDKLIKKINDVVLGY